jgi:DNA-binding response OmpR family regulator
LRILVIEDEPKVARALGEGLRRAGYEVAQAATGEEGLFTASARLSISSSST